RASGLEIRVHRVRRYARLRLFVSAALESRERVLPGRLPLRPLRGCALARGVRVLARLSARHLMWGRKVEGRRSNAEKASHLQPLNLQPSTFGLRPDGSIPWT